MLGFKLLFMYKSGKVPEPQIGSMPFENAPRKTSFFEERKQKKQNKSKAKIVRVLVYIPRICMFSEDLSSLFFITHY